MFEFNTILGLDYIDIELFLRDEIISLELPKRCTSLLIKLVIKAKGETT